MPQLNFGKKGQIKFKTANEFYEALGFLCKSNQTTKITWEKNEEQGAWGSEGRIQCYRDISRFPDYFKRAFTKGSGNAIHRINCNQYIEYIVKNYHFKIGFDKDQDRLLIKSSIPIMYHADFENGKLL